MFEGETMHSMKTESSRLSKEEDDDSLKICSP